MQVRPFSDGAIGIPGPAFLVAGLEPEEPIFVFRARDTLALGILSQYAMMVQQADLFDANRLSDLRADIQHFAAWRRKYVEAVRDPD